MFVPIVNSFSTTQANRKETCSIQSEKGLASAKIFLSLLTSRCPLTTIQVIQINDLRGRVPLPEVYYVDNQLRCDYIVRDVWESQGEDGASARSQVLKLVLVSKDRDPAIFESQTRFGDLFC